MQTRANLTMRSFVWVLAFGSVLVALPGGCAQNDSEAGRTSAAGAVQSQEPQTKSKDQSEIEKPKAEDPVAAFNRLGIKAVASMSELPPCVPEFDKLTIANVDNATFYVCMNSHWQPFEALKGDRGEKGDTGITGATGANGTAGSAGRDYVRSQIDLEKIVVNYFTLETQVTGRDQSVSNMPHTYGLVYSETDDFANKMTVGRFNHFGQRFQPLLPNATKLLSFSDPGFLSLGTYDANDQLLEGLSNPIMLRAARGMVFGNHFEKLLPPGIVVYDIFDRNDQYLWLHVFNATTTEVDGQSKTFYDFLARVNKSDFGDFTLMAVPGGPFEAFPVGSLMDAKRRFWFFDGKQFVVYDPDQPNLESKLPLRNLDASVSGLELGPNGYFLVASSDKIYKVDPITLDFSKAKTLTDTAFKDMHYGYTFTKSGKVIKGNSDGLLVFDPEDLGSGVTQVTEDLFGNGLPKYLAMAEIEPGVILGTSYGRMVVFHEDSILDTFRILPLAELPESLNRHGLKLFPMYWRKVGDAYVFYDYNSRTLHRVSIDPTIIYKPGTSARLPAGCNLVATPQRGPMLCPEGFDNTFRPHFLHPELDCDTELGRCNQCIRQLGESFEIVQPKPLSKECAIRLDNFFDETPLTERICGSYAVQGLSEENESPALEGNLTLQSPGNFIWVNKNLEVIALQYNEEYGYLQRTGNLDGLDPKAKRFDLWYSIGATLAGFYFNGYQFPIVNSATGPCESSSTDDD